MFSMAPTANTSNGQAQLDLYGATAQSSAPVFGSIPPPAFGVSYSLALSTPILDSTTEPEFDLGLMDTSESLSDMLSFELPTNPSATTGFAWGSFGATTTQVPQTTMQPACQLSLVQSNFQQIIDLINNWTVSLEKQEKQFLDQANEITVWDNILTNQSTKIIKQYDTLKQKEKEQLEMEKELELFISQQKEIEDCLVSLEQELQSDEVLSSLNNKNEPIHKAAQEIDNQVKQMSGDVKEIVNNLNNANSNKDSDDDLDTICKILNCHMTALQYIEHNVENLSEMVTEVNEQHARFLSAANDSSSMVLKNKH